MIYDEQEVLRAFKMYSKLAINGLGIKDDFRLYIVDNKIRGLVNQFADEMQCVIFVAGDLIYMIPKAISSEFHISNDSIKKRIFKKDAKNEDLYTMYIIIIILFGEFYDGYQSINPTRDFVSISHWLEAVNERMLSIKEHGEEKLKKLEKDNEYNWVTILKRWESMDDLKENLKVYDSRSETRLSLINVTKSFLIDEDLINDLGNNEIELTEKAKIIIQRYYMEYDFNRGLLEFIYDVENKKGES